MPCHHCGKARKAARDAVLATARGDRTTAVAKAREAASHVADKLRDEADRVRGRVVRVKT